MRKDIDHLPSAQRGELERVQCVLMDEFAEAISEATSPSRKNGKILKIILFGSYARDDWIDEPENGCKSDSDLLVVVSHSDLPDIPHYWVLTDAKLRCVSSTMRLAYDRITVVTGRVGSLRLNV